ncbi:hypothetical protein CN603_12895 [Bacillus toyonensis]|uniref:hypothetical protein n=1 Tax=Bacillus toyonensis TaxID=155322 RepID=UPI000BF02514|nr:hypothetical protein [Bacillus toyonensis]PEL75381.1 hypothetical protein CN603_12895 [Bacillus toyonensis]
MCIKCYLKELAAATVGVEVKEEVIGKATEEQVKELRSIRNETEAIKEVVAKELKAELEPIKEKYKKKLESVTKGLEERHDAVWTAIHSELGVNGEDGLTLNVGTGEITKQVIKKKESGNLH